MKSTSQKAELHRFYKAELLLIRAGQHLFRERRDKGRKDKDLEASFECIWRLKRELRASKVELSSKNARHHLSRRSRGI
jgi:hypothetical protein